MESSRVTCTHCYFLFYPEEGVAVDDCPVCGRTVEVKPAPAPPPGEKEFTFDSFTHALNFIAASLTDLGGEQEALDTVCAHISDLTRRLAEAEAENGRFAGMLEDSVSGWRKLYTEERAERVRIEGVLLNDVQAERQESDEHINGLNAVIKTQDKAIRDLKSRVVELAADWQVQFAKAEAAEARVRELEAFKARVMEWARWRCGACEHEGSEDDTCYNCQSDYEQSNGTPPKAWEVGE